MALNLMVHITLPKKLALTTGAVLAQEVTFDILGDLHPFYASVDLIRLEGGMYLTKISDLTLAAMGYHASLEADALSYTAPPDPLEGATPSAQWRLFDWAREQFVAVKAAHALILNVFDLAGTRGHRTLANFSIARQEFNRGEGLPGKLVDLAKEIKELKVVLKSGAAVGPGGHAHPRMAAKGYYDSSDGRPGRLWITSGPGANATTISGRTATGGRGKPVKFYSPWYVQRRLGRYAGPVILSVGYFGVI